MGADCSTIVQVTRRLSASPKSVFDAWLDPDLVGRWMFGPLLRDEEVLRIDIDPRVDGSFSFLVRRQGQEIDHIGTYLKLDAPRRLVFTWAVAPAPVDSSRVTIELVPEEGGTQLTLTHEMAPEWAAYKAKVEESWAKMLATLEQVLA